MKINRMDNGLAESLKSIISAGLLACCCAGLQATVLEKGEDEPPPYCFPCEFTAPEDESGCSVNSTLVNSMGGLSLLQAGSLSPRQTIEVYQALRLCPPLELVARGEHLGEPSLSEDPPALMFIWHNVTWPEVLGPVNVTTPFRESLSTHCQPMAGDDLNCTTSLAGTAPIAWLLIRAGSLPDAETLSYAQLPLSLWQIPAGSWSGYSDSRLLTLSWRQPAVAAEGFQVDVQCHNGNWRTTLVATNHYEEPVEAGCHQNCTFQVIPVYRGFPCHGFGIKLSDAPVGILCTFRQMPATDFPAFDDPSPGQWWEYMLTSMVVTSSMVGAMGMGVAVCYMKVRGVTGM